jgi:hypothetical protein
VRLQYVPPMDVSTNSPSDTINLWCRDVAENVQLVSPISLEEIQSTTTSKSSIKDLDHFTNEDSMPQDSSDESISSEPSYLHPSKVDSSYQVDFIVDVPSSMVEDNHAVALVQVLPPDTELFDVPDYVDIYHITIMDDSVIGEDPPPSDGSYENHNYDEEASSLNYDPNQEVLNEEDMEDYNHDHDYGYKTGAEVTNSFSFWKAEASGESHFHFCFLQVRLNSGRAWCEKSLTNRQ